MKDVEPDQHTPVCPVTEELFPATIHVHELGRCLVSSPVPLHEAFSHRPHFIQRLLAGQDRCEDLAQLVGHVGAPLRRALSIPGKFLADLIMNSKKKEIITFLTIFFNSQVFSQLIRFVGRLSLISGIIIIYIKYKPKM